MSNRPLEIDCVAGSEIRDSQGEILSVEGADISALEAGTGIWSDNHSRGFFNTLGRITYGKKIFKEEDCEDDRQRYYWNQIKAPYIYAKGILYSDDDHPNAKAAAAILRNIHKTDSPLKIKASVEGGIVSRGIKDPRFLAHTVVRGVALTFSPANSATLVEPINLEKCQHDEAADMALIRSVMHLAQDNVPSFRQIERIGSAYKVHQNLNQISDMLAQIRGAKSLPISIPSPMELTQAALEQKIVGNVQKIHEAIVTEDLMEKNMKGAIAGALMSGAMTLMPPSLSGIAEHKKPAMTPAAFVEKLQDKAPTLWSIAQIESTGGKMLDHDVVKHGLNKGMRAGGPWGMMPKTFADTFNKSHALQQKYAQLAPFVKDIDANHDNVTKALNTDPQLAYLAASELYNKLHKLHGSDIDKIAHSWREGVAGTQHALKSGKKLSDHPYVKKLKETHPKLRKALMAGYGGAAAPTNRIQGAVMQSEALEDNKPKKIKGFRYVTCDKCGHDQVHHKYAVKCRSCNQPFSMETLFKLLSNLQ